VIGPVPLWRRVLWWFVPPSHAKMIQIVPRLNHQTLRDVTRFFRPSRQWALSTYAGVRCAAETNDLCGGDPAPHSTGR
jgi:hypothetical protein